MLDRIISAFFGHDEHHQCDATLGGQNALINDGWSYEALGTNTATPGLMNGNYTPDPGVFVGWPGGTEANFAVAGWSANIGTTWQQAKTWWNNGNPTAGPSGYFAISGIATYILVGDPYFGLYPVTTTFGPTPGYQVQGFTLNRYTLPPLVVTTAASVWFEWGAPAAYGNSTPLVSVGNGTSAVPASAALNGFNPSVAYHYRIVGSNSAGMTYGSDMTFVNPLPQSDHLFSNGNHSVRSANACSADWQSAMSADW